jgi:hypothetical protein
VTSTRRDTSRAAQAPDLLLRSGARQLFALYKWAVRVRNNRLDAAPACSAGAARGLLVAGAVQNVIRRALCLGRRVNQKPALIANLLEPAGHVGGLIRNYRI